MIGFFDSGVGGLTVVKAVLKRLPQYQIMYLGDSARTPYGNRSQEVIYQFTQQAVAYLFEHGCELVVVACNTASAEALRRIQQEWLPQHYPDRRVLGVIRPVAEEAARVSKFGRIGVVGTRGTISSGAFEREIRHIRPDAVISQQACPLLVPLIEEGWLKRPETNRIIRSYLRPLKQKRIDTLVLGCTHYPMLLKQFRAIAGRSVTVLDAATIVAEKLADYLARHPEIETKLTESSDHHFLVTDSTPQFAQLARQWLGREVVLEKITLEK
jgi:glutamate racemase